MKKDKKSILRNALLVIAAAGLVWLSGLQVADPAEAKTHILAVESLLQEDGTLDTTTGVSGTLDMRGFQARIDLQHGPVPSRKDKTLMAEATWSALAHNGLDERVLALTVVGSDLYVGGSIRKSADGNVKHLNHIAKYTNGAWSVLPNSGLNGEVSAIAVMGPICSGRILRSVQRWGGDKSQSHRQVQQRRMVRAAR